MSIGMNWINWANCASEDCYKPVSQTTKRSPCKSAQILRPGASGASVFIDEDEYSIDNGAFGLAGVGLGATPALFNWNTPAKRHSRGAVLSFGDGHAEHWRWSGDHILRTGDINNFTTPPNTPGNLRDYTRLQGTVDPES